MLNYHRVNNNVAYVHTVKHSEEHHMHCALKTEANLSTSNQISICNNWIWYWRKTRSSPQQPSKGQEIEPAMIERPPCHMAQHGGQRNLGKGVIFCHVQSSAVTKDTKAHKQWGSTLALQRKGLPAAVCHHPGPNPMSGTPVPRVCSAGSMSNHV